MLESEIKKLTAAVVELNATLQSKGTGAAPAASTAGTPAASLATVAPAAAPTPAPAPAPAPAPTPPPAAATAAPAVDKKTMTETFIKLAQDKGREVAANILAQFGVSKLPDLKDEAQWPAFHAQVVAALEQ